MEHQISTFLQIGVVFCSMLAAIFWMASATGYKLTWRFWQNATMVDQAQRSEHQTRWNANAAAMTGLTAVFQAIFFLYQNPLPTH